MELLYLKQYTDALHQGELSSVELTQYFLNKIKKHKDLNAFISLDEEYALHAAQKADRSMDISS